jgi:hypothetical protein
MHEEDQMSISGIWVLHFSWGCTNNYSPVNITFNPNGTFTGPGTGQWRQRDGTVMLSFDTGPAKYGGTVNGNVGSGASSTFAGLNGCWYLVKQGTSGLQIEPAAQSHDPSGNQV